MIPKNCRLSTPPTTPSKKEDKSSFFLYTDENLEGEIGLEDWRLNFERECVEKIEQVLQDISQQFTFVREFSLLDILKKKVKERQKRFIRDICQVDNFEGFAKVVRREAKDELKVLMNEKNLPILKKISEGRAFTIRSIAEDLHDDYSLVYERVRVAVKKLQRLGIIRTYILQKPHINRILKTGIFFLPDATENDLAAIIGQQISIDRGFGSSTTGTERVIEHNEQISKASQQLQQEKEKKKNENVVEVVQTKVKKKIVNTIIKNEAESYTKEIEREYKKNRRKLWECKLCHKKFETDVDTIAQNIDFCPNCKSSVKRFKLMGEVIRPTITAPQILKTLPQLAEFTERREEL